MSTKSYSANPPAIGCYCDSARGFDGCTLHAIRLAQGFGFVVDAQLQGVIDRHNGESEESGEGRDSEILSCAADEVEAFLNELETRPFLSWGWSDGDFGLWPNIDGALDDCAFVSCRSQAAARANGYDCDPEDSERPAGDFRGEWLHVSDHGNVTLYVREDAGNGFFVDREIWAVC